MQLPSPCAKAYRSMAPAYVGLIVDSLPVLLCCSARIPWYMIWLNYLSTFKYPLQMMMINQFQALDAVCWDPPPPDGLTATTCVLTSAEVLKSFDMAGINIWTNALVMLAFFVGYRFLFYLLLKWHAASVRA